MIQEKDVSKETKHRPTGPSRARWTFEWPGQGNQSCPEPLCGLVWFMIHPSVSLKFGQELCWTAASRQGECGFLATTNGVLRRKGTCTQGHAATCVASPRQVPRFLSSTLPGMCSLKCVRERGGGTMGGERAFTH